MRFLTLLFVWFIPRVLIVAWWLIDRYRFLAPFHKITALPILGALLGPWTTLAYALVWHPSSGPWGSDLLWLGLGVAVDAAHYVAYWYNHVLLDNVAGQYLNPK